MGLPLGPRVELSKICGPSGRVSCGSPEGCCALMTTVITLPITATIASAKYLIEVPLFLTHYCVNGFSAIFHLPVCCRSRKN